MISIVIVAMLVALPVAAEFAAAEDEAAVVAPLEQRFVADQRIDESSGLARSHATEGRFWTHNDSGDSARIFAIDRQSEVVRCLSLDSIEAIDWEDITSFQMDGRNWILVGDVGDNGRRRNSVLLYLFEEPAFDGQADGQDTDFKIEASAITTIEVVYPDGPGDCEAIAIDTRNQRLLMIKKTFLPLAGVYAVDLQGIGGPFRTVSEKASQRRASVGVIKAQAKHLMTLPIPTVTAMDIRADGKMLALTTYRDLFIYQRSEHESWEQVLKRTPSQMVLPHLRQIEAVCFDREGEVWVSSERSPMALFKLNTSGLFAVVGVSTPD